MMGPSRTDDEPTFPDEHSRFEHYVNVLAQVPDEDELAMVAAVLNDADQVMAQSAVIRHLDLRATALYQGPEYPAWAQKMADVIDQEPFVVQRLQEWSLFRAITLTMPWTADALIAASDWLQRKVAESATSAEALAVLAKAGRTRRVRNIADVKLGSKPAYPDWKQC